MKNIFLVVFLAAAGLATSCATAGRPVGYAYPGAPGWPGGQTLVVYQSPEDIAILRGLDARDREINFRHNENMAKIRSQESRERERYEYQRSRDEARAREQATREISRLVQNAQRSAAARQRERSRAITGLTRDYLRGQAGASRGAGR